MRSQNPVVPRPASTQKRINAILSCREGKAVPLPGGGGGTSSVRALRVHPVKRWSGFGVSGFGLRPPGTRATRGPLGLTSKKGLHGLLVTSGPARLLWCWCLLMKGGANLSSSYSSVFLFLSGICAGQGYVRSDDVRAHNHNAIPERSRMWLVRLVSYIPPPKSLRLSSGILDQPGLKQTWPSTGRLTSRLFDCWTKASSSNRQGEPSSREDRK